MVSLPLCVCRPCFIFCDMKCFDVNDTESLHVVFYNITVHHKCIHVYLITCQRPALCSIVANTGALRPLCPLCLVRVVLHIDAFATLIKNL